MKKTILPNLMLMVFVLCGVKNARAKHSLYGLSVRAIKHSNMVRVRLKNQATGRTIWMKTLSNYRESYWSSDHRAVAVETSDVLLVWRAGQRLLTIEFPGGHKLGSPQGYDYSMGYGWSRDKQRLLVRFGASGDADVGGALYCLKFGPRHYRYIKAPTPNLVSKVAWKSNRTVLYWTYDFLSGDSKNPRRWLVP